MRPVSDEYLRTIRGTHGIRVEARVLGPGATGTDPAGTALSIISGDVRLDGTADIRSTLDLMVDGAGMWPTRSSALELAPYGNEVFVRRGVRLGSGATEWVSLGYFRIKTIEQDRPPDGPIRITGEDRMAGIKEARLVAPVQFGDTATVGSVVAQLVTDVYPWATIEWDDATDADELARSVIAEEDRFAFLNDLVTARGKIWYWDHRGVLVIKDVPSAADPVWDVDAGAGGVLVSASRNLSRVGVYNAVVASGQAADTTTPARAVVTDDNPVSPTYWLGDFGKVPRFYSSPFITDDAQAEGAAAAMLTKALGLPYSVDFTAVPNCALEPYDPATVAFSGSGARETHVFETLTVPLTAAAPLKGSTREQTVVLLGVS